jgi:hypothetical protein
MKIAAIGAGLAALSLFAVPAQAQEQDRRPKIGVSMSEKAEDAPPLDGLLYQRARAALAAAERSDTEFAAFLTPAARANFINFTSDGTLVKIPFDAALVRAIRKSCLAPLAYDEAAHWVQISWVCRTDAAAPISAFTRFRYNPELIATIYFEREKISAIDAMETLMVPGRPRYRMDAYALMGGKVE